VRQHHADSPFNIDSGHSRGGAAPQQQRTRRSGGRGATRYGALGGVDGVDIDPRDLEVAMELGHDRPFEVNHLVHYFMGRWWRVAYDLFTLAYLGGVLVSYTAVFVSSITSLVPVPGVSPSDLATCDVYKDGDFPKDCEHAYMIYTALFALIAVPLACLEPTEQVFVQVFLTGYRFVALFTMIASCAAGIATGPYTPPGIAASAAAIAHKAPHWGSDVHTFRWAGATSAVSACTFAQLTHHSAGVLVSPLAQKRRSRSMFGLALATTGFFYCTLGLMCSAYFGELTSPVVTLNWVGYRGFGTDSGDGAGGHVATPWWAYFVRWVVMLFPVLDLISAFPLTAITASKLAAFSLPPTRTAKLACSLVTAVLPIVLGYFFRRLDSILQFTGLVGLVIAFVVPGALQVMSVARASRAWGPAAAVTTPYSSGGPASSVPAAYAGIALGVSLFAYLGVALFVPALEFDHTEV
jgi:hypothetical protein